MISDEISMNMLTRPRVQTVREIIGDRWPEEDGTKTFSIWQAVKKLLPRLSCDCLPEMTSLASQTAKPKT